MRGVVIFIKRYMYKKIFLLFFCLVALIYPAFCEEMVMNTKPKVKLGIEVLLADRLDLINGKKIGLITNQTGVDSHLRSSIDLLFAVPGVKLSVLFGPEHGIYGGVQNAVENSRDVKTGLPVYNLSGEKKAPSPESLRGIDTLIFDLQDIGSRTYTYISTMEACMETAAKEKIKFIVLDRPNPVNGLIVDGPVLEDDFKSFIGIGPIPYMHGMTIGELAFYFNKEFGINCDLEVVKMQGWQRSMSWKDTGLIWVPTSPHIPEPDTPWFYPITGGLSDLYAVSEGVGYTLPFKIVGAPWMDAEKFSRVLNDSNIPGVYFQPFYFKPYYGNFKDEFCKGVRIIITDENKIKPFLTGLYIMESLKKLYPDRFNLKLDGKTPNSQSFDKVMGTDRIRLMLEKGIPVGKIEESYKPGLNDFIKIRAKYLLYR